MATSAQWAVDPSRQSSEAPARVWRPLATDIADSLCIEAEGDIQPCMHSRFAISLVLAGSVVRVESSRSLVTDADSVLVIPALHLHSWRGERAARRATTTLLISETELEGIPMTDRAALVTDGETSDRLNALLSELRGGPSVAIKSMLRAVLQRVVSRSVPVSSPRSIRATPLISLRDYLRAHLSEPVSIETLVRISGLTEWHLIRAFHLEFGLPPHAYHMRLRLASAAELLLRGLSVSTTAYECGFADQSHLSRKFKQVYGLTPAAWARSAAAAPSANVRPLLQLVHD